MTAARGEKGTAEVVPVASFASGASLRAGEGRVKFRARGAPLVTPPATEDERGRAAQVGSTGKGVRTVLGALGARSPLRLLTPRNHGLASWIYTSSFGGGLLARDHVRLGIDVDAGAFGFVSTQASTKVYRTPSARARMTGEGLAEGDAHVADEGARQTTRIRVAPGGALALVPDPVVCFAGAQYTQRTEVALHGDASLLLFDAYTSGRAARGERWAFARYRARTEVTREGAPLVTESIRLDPPVVGLDVAARAEGMRGLAQQATAPHGPRSIAARMGRFDVLASLIVAGPRFAPVRDALNAIALPPLGGPAGRMREPAGAPAREGACARERERRSADEPLVSLSPRPDPAGGGDALVVRLAAVRFESIQRVLRPCFAALAEVLGDDPFARKR